VGGFSFSIPSLMTLAVITGILLFSLIALNWPGITPISLTDIGIHADELAERELAAFAGIPLLDAPVQYEDIPLDMMETFEWKAHKVARGETVYQIARDYGISMDAIIASNNISNARRLTEGASLRIPNMDGIPYTVKKGDTLTKISASMNIPLELILDVNDIQTDVITPGQILFMPGARMAPDALKLALGELFVYPVKGRLSDTFGFRNSPITNVRQFHSAIDLAAPTGVPVKAAMDGKVSATGNNTNYGKFIIMSHAGGYETLYAHLSVISVTQGAVVNQGVKIGEVGSTGFSTGPHLHFAIYKNKRPVNPLDLLR
jgi:murein DD-endopeptidase MepM/ murein hydrolase activator NlpD